MFVTIKRSLERIGKHTGEYGDSVARSKDVIAQVCTTKGRCTFSSGNDVGYNIMLYIHSVKRQKILKKGRLQ